MPLPRVAGLESFKAPTSTNKGILAMPIEFDSKHFVGKWAKQGTDVTKARQDEHLPYADAKAKGWEVWKGPKGVTCKRTLHSGVYVLMCRPRVLQEAVNAIHGNVSRTRMANEANGRTVAGAERQDTGILPNSVLRNIPGLSSESEPELHVPMNEIQTHTARPVSARASSRITSKLKTS